MERILSIQSHVVSGYVGNKAAVFPLQLLGFDVDVVNSVHFSNHTGYAHGVRGDVLDGNQLKEVLEGLEVNGLLNNIQHLLTGYIGSESFLTAVLHVLDTVRKHNPKVRFVCDPVLGDHGEFYVPPELVPLYREKVIPVADVVTPNQFEVEQLTGIKVESIEDARTACKALHDMGPSLVIITSIEMDGNKDILAVLASKRTNGEDEVWRIDTPVVPGAYTGTGDLCAALFLGHTALEDTLASAMEKVIGTMHAVISRTHEHCDGSVAGKELKLIASKRDIENPPSHLKAYKLQ
mmetsp:Transcript_9667/g.16139  ORF Transcript_9667/g.16139 Transcript_9667/m.16139 type:complete len:293 (-) Transcript_9667:31-909(-)